MAKELELKYGCNPNQKPSRTFMQEGELPIEVLNGRPGYINFLDAVKEAEQFAADDKKKREEVDVRNGADSMVFQTEKTLKEMGDKVPAEIKTEAETKLSGTIDEIKAKQEELQKVFENLYQQAAQAQQAAGAQPGAEQQNPQGGQNDDGVVDADFKEV